LIEIRIALQLRAKLIGRIMDNLS